MLPGAEAVADSEPHELKIKIHTALHVKLQTLKLLRGVTMSEVVSAALDQYLSSPTERRA